MRKSKSEECRLYNFMSEEDYVEKVIVSFDFWLKQSADIAHVWIPRRVRIIYITGSINPRDYRKEGMMKQPTG
jgi:hypothetical protein